MTDQPTKTMELYGGKIHIDFYEQYGRYKHVYIHREKNEWPISVTKITGNIDKSTALMIWQKRMIKDALVEAVKKKIKLTAEKIIEIVETAERAKQEGAEFGGMVHDWIEHYIAGQEDEMPKQEKPLNGVTGFLRLVKEMDAEFVLSEKIVYSKKYGYVGKTDAAIKLKLPGFGNKKLICPLDYKTNNWRQDYDYKTKQPIGERYSMVYIDQRAQLSAYKHAQDEEFPGFYTGPRLIWAIDKLTGNFKQHILDDPNAPSHEKDFGVFLGAFTIEKRNRELKEIMRHD